MQHARTDWRSLLCAALFPCLLHAPFLFDAYAVDEPHYLAIARHILEDPLRPLSFDYNWFGKSAPMRDSNTQPPFASYFLAAALRAAGGSEWAMRLLCLPFEAAAAAALYLLAARFLLRPLLPTLIVLAGPGYFLNMRHLMLEKWMGAFGFCGLYAAVRGVEEGRRAWAWTGAALLGAALLSKVSAVFLLPTLAAFCLSRGVPWMRVMPLLGMASAPLAVYAAWSLLADPGEMLPLFKLTASGAAAPWAHWSHRLRSLLSFTGGCGVVIVPWPFLLCYRPSRPSRLAVPACAAAAVFLFLPMWDILPAGPFDRCFGALLSAGSLLAWIIMAGPDARAGPGWWLWFPWAFSVTLLQGGVYWSVVSRYVLFAAAPMVFALASQLESRFRPAFLRGLYGASLAATLALTLGLSWVDSAYANAQRDLARMMRTRRAGRQSQVWFTGHWGLQHYMEEIGAKGLDSSRGGWEEVRPGDWVVVPSVNSNIIRPRRPVSARLERVSIRHPLPLRLMGFGAGRAGFYSSVWGFLPFSFSTEPLEEFVVLEVSS